MANITTAIHAVYILKENILFLEEWIDYHTQLGFDKFYLYDNSKVQVKCRVNRTNNIIIPGKKNKRGVVFDDLINVDEEQMKDYIHRLCDKYKGVNIVEWSPTDENGMVMYAQSAAHAHCLKRLKRDKIDWCASIDMDEFIVIKDYTCVKDYIKTTPGQVDTINMGQLRFETRFNHVNKLVTDINLAEKQQCARENGVKNIFNVDKTSTLQVHHTVTEGGRWNERLASGDVWKPSRDEICINHYNGIFNTRRHGNSYTRVDNINVNIKKRLKHNSRSYIPII